MELIQQLITYDKALFVFLNTLNSTYFDSFMLSISKVGVWIPFYVSVVYVLIKSYSKSAVWHVLLLVLSVVLCDQISVLFKDNFMRLRPSHNPDFEQFIHLVNGKKGGYFGFVSSHAANTAGFAMLLILLTRNKILTIAVSVWVLLVSYSRIYLGLHYPLDIIGGITLGVLIALVLFFIATRFQAFKMNFVDTKIATTTLVLTFVVIAILSIWI